jgi:hypothetical protein
MSGKLDGDKDVLRSGWPEEVVGGGRCEGRWMSVMVNVPPVAGMRETSPRAVENVERSSCAYWTKTWCEKMIPMEQEDWGRGSVL